MVHADTIIVGAGPIGLELAVALKHAGVDYLHIDAGQIGQTISWYPKQVRFFSSPERIAIAGVPLETVDQEKATREQYLAYLRGVVQQFDLAVNTYERVTAIERDGDGFTLRTTKQDYAANRVVLAIGDMHRPRKLNIPGEDLPHVSHYFDEPHRYFRQKLLIVGGRNSAAEAAIRCARVGAKVTISHRSSHFDAGSVKYWLLPELESMIKADVIDYHPNTQPIEITSDHVVLDPGRMVIPADFVLLLTGYVMDPALFEQIGAELEPPHQSPKVDKDTMMTTVANLYVAGTAAAGTRTHTRLFIENCHPHVTKIVKSITGSAPPAGLVNDAARQYALPES